jgi:hypothetical protein
MMGWSGTFSEKSALTVIFWPAAGTLMCWYMVERVSSGTAGRAGGPGQPRVFEPEILVHGVCQPTDESARFQQAPLTNEAAASLNALQRITEMNKLLAALIVAAFATTGAFAADAKKDEKKAAPAAAAAPAAKKEEAKPAAAAPAAAPAAKKEEAKPAKAAAPAAKKEEPKK